MTKQEYVRKLAELYYEANMSDTEHKPDWIARTGFVCWIFAFGVVLLKSC